MTYPPITSEENVVDCDLSEFFPEPTRWSRLKCWFGFHNWDSGFCCRCLVDKD